jgi:hypothetical protein
MTCTKGIRMKPFGVGRTICAELSIAMLHLESFVANMVREFEWKEAPIHEVEFGEKRAHHCHEEAAAPAPRAKDKEDLIGGALQSFSSGLFGEIEKSSSSCRIICICTCH